MKKSKFPYIVFILINLAVAVSCFFYPVSRDEFYYLDLRNVPNPFLEYYNSYLFGNPRIGQFFANIISRNKLFEMVFGMLLFNAFISVLFLNIYRKFPDFRQSNEIRKFLWLSGFFIFFINYFGEMFYYTPYSSNYTFTHVFYLLYVFIICEYYLHENKSIIKNVPVLVFLISGIVIGMANEHVPPVLVGVSLLCAFIYYLKNKKFPNLKLIVLPVFTIIGYAILFFAPANKIKEKVVGKSVLNTNLSDYLASWMKILKIYFYYNRELLGLMIVVVLVIIVWNKQIEKSIFPARKILFWGLLFLLPLMIVGISPLIGTRLLFFSTCILIIILYKIILVLIELKHIRINIGIVYAFLFLFFGMSVIMTFRANQNYEMLISEIEQKSKQTKNIELDHHLNYFTLDIHSYFNLNRKIFLESGRDYIDTDASHDTSMEKNLKNYYQLNTIKEK